jgi:WD40 repeat protein
MLLPFNPPEESFSPYVRFSPRGRRVLVAPERGGWAVVLDVSSGKQTHRLAGAQGNVRAQFLAEDRLLLQTEGGLTSQDLATGRAVWSEPELLGWGAWVNPRRGRVLVGRGMRLRLHDLKTRKRVRSFGPVVPGEVISGEFSPDGRLFALDLFHGREEYTQRRYAQLWEVRCEFQYRLVEIEVRGNGDRGAMAFSPDNRLLAVSLEGGVLLFDVKKGKPVGETAGPVVADSVRFSPGGRSLEIVSFDGEVYRTDAKTGRVRQHAPAPEGHEIEACAVNNQGLAAGVVGAALLFWQLPEWEGA